MNAPKRAFELIVTIGADTWADALVEMDRLADHIREHGPRCHVVSGGCSSGAYVDIRHDPTMTPERYVEELTAYLKSRRRSENT